MSNLLSIFIVPLAMVSWVNFLVYNKYSVNLCEINERTELLPEYNTRRRLHTKNVRRGLTHYRHSLNYPEARVEVAVKVVIILVRLLVILLEGKKVHRMESIPWSGGKVILQWMWRKTG